MPERHDTESDPEEESDQEMEDDKVCDPNASKSPMSAVDSQEDESGESESEECVDPALIHDRNPDDVSDFSTTDESGTTLVLPGVKRTHVFPPTPPADEPMSSESDEEEEGG